MTRQETENYLKWLDKHSQCMRDFAAGQDVEILIDFKSDVWMLTNHPDWGSHNIFRTKQKPEEWWEVRDAFGAIKMRFSTEAKAREYAVQGLYNPNVVHCTFVP